MNLADLCQCDVCRWLCERSKAIVWVANVGSYAKCPECGAELPAPLGNRQPLPGYPMQDETRTWLRAAGFRDWGVEKPKARGGEPMRRWVRAEVPMLCLLLDAKATPGEAALALHALGEAAQAERTREALTRLCDTVRRGQAVPEAELAAAMIPEPSTELLMP